MERAQARALVLYPGSDESKFAGYTLGHENLLRDPNAKPYAGELPYAVVSLDGTEHSDLKGWTAQAASATLLDRFFQSDERLAKALTLATDALSLYNDVEFQKRAIDELKAASASQEANKAAHEVMAEAYAKNIQNDSIRKTVNSSD